MTLGLAKDVVALFVHHRGPYPLRVAEWYDLKRDARTYRGDLPVIAHPPCQRWCRFAGLVEARWGHKRGEDGGLFKHALETLRRCGGVLEHPAYSDAWPAFKLPRPPTGGGWVPGAAPFEWTCYVEQYQYGHDAKKATWLYYVGAVKPFALRWSLVDDHKADTGFSWTNWRDNVRPALVERFVKRDRKPAWIGNHVNGHRANVGTPPARRRLTKKQAAVTPPEFLEVLVRLARRSRG